MGGWGGWVREEVIMSEHGLRTLGMEREMAASTKELGRLHTRTGGGGESEWNIRYERDNRVTKLGNGVGNRTTPPLARAYFCFRSRTGSGI